MPLLLRKHLGTAAVLEPSEQITIEYHVSCSLNGPKVSLAHFFSGSYSQEQHVPSFSCFHMHPFKLNSNFATV